MKKLWPLQVGQSFLSHRGNFVATKFIVATEKLCHDRENSITIKLYVATEKLFFNRENSVATEKTLTRQKRLKNPEKPKNCCVGLFSSPFHPRTINTRFFFRFLGEWEGGRTPLMGFFSLNCPFFSSFSGDFDFLWI